MIGRLDNRTLADPQCGSINLVAMPWASASRPSIQVGILHGLLASHGLPVISHSLHLHFQHFISQRSSAAVTLGLADYELVSEDHYLGEAIFSGPPLNGDSWSDFPYLTYLREVGPERPQFTIAEEFRRYIPSFLDDCAARICSTQPSAVGFTTTLNQTLPSLALAALLKKTTPDLPIVFGGANCEGPMGRALFERFEFIDVVVQGEGEEIAPPLFQALLQSEPIPSSDQIISRIRRQSVARTSTPTAKRNPAGTIQAGLPNYDEYFHQIDHSPNGEQLRGRVSIPVETSRGCWWGEKSHCNFCGLNGLSMKFRAKNADQAISEISALSNRYSARHFTAADNILSHNAFEEFLPKITSLNRDWTFFYETKANLRLDQLKALRNAGVRSIQPGIESLSTTILKLMRKGSSSLQNVRLLKWCADLDIEVAWNLIYGFPGEDPQEYARMAALAPSLVHLEPPTICALGLERFSPYFEDPEKYGIRVVGPAPFYRYAYSAGTNELMNLAYSFQFEYLDSRTPLEYAEPLIKACLIWREAKSLRSAFRSLQYFQKPRCVLVRDRRPGLRPMDLELSGLGADVLVACEAGASAPKILETVLRSGRSIVLASVIEQLERLIADRLVMQDGDNFLSLPCHANDDLCAEHR